MYYHIYHLLQYYRKINYVTTNFTNTYVIIYSKQMEPQTKWPRDSFTRLWKIDLIEGDHVRFNNVQQLKLNIDPSITPVPTYRHHLQHKRTTWKVLSQSLIQSSRLNIHQIHHLCPLFNLAQPHCQSNPKFPPKNHSNQKSQFRISLSENKVNQ